MDANQTFRIQPLNETYNQWQKSWDALFFPYLAVLVIASLPTPKAILSLINLTLRLYFNIVRGKRGVRKIKYKLLKSKDFVMEHYSIQCPKYFCH